MDSDNRAYLWTILITVFIKKNTHLFCVRKKNTSLRRFLYAHKTYVDRQKRKESFSVG